MEKAKRQSRGAVRSRHTAHRGLKAASIALSVVLGGGLVPAVAIALETGGATAAAGDASSAPADDYAKSQVVYAKLSAYGAQTGVYVVNTFSSEQGGTVVDKGDYLKLKNLSDSQQLEGAGAVSFAVAPGTDFSYQGDLAAGTELPWTISAGYKLDGKDVTADELGGASGKLEMTLSIAPNFTAGTSTYIDNYLLQVTAQLSNDRARNIEAPDATAAQSSGCTQLTYMVFPGKSARYTVTAQVDGFEFSGWQIAGVPLSIALSIDDGEFSDASTSLDELESAIRSVDSGASQLSEGIESAEAGTDTLATGLETLAAGSGEYLATLSAQSQALRQGASASSLDEASGNLQSHLTQLGSYSGIFANAFGTAYATAYAPAFAVAYQTYLAQGYAPEQAMAAASADASATAAAAGAQAAAEAGVTEEAIAATAAQAGADASDIGNLSAAGALDGAASGYADLGAGTAACAQGAAALQSGIAQVSEGAGTLASGTSQLVGETSGLSTTMIDTVRDKLTSYLNPSFTLKDFANGDTAHIRNVQFVYLTDSIEVPAADAEDDASAEVQNAGFFDKLAALFRG